VNTPRLLDLFCGQAVLRNGIRASVLPGNEGTKMTKQKQEGATAPVEKLSPDDALAALNTLRSNVIATQNAGWSNTLYPFVAILNAAGCEQFDPDEQQLAEHYDCYGGAGGYPGNTKDEPSHDARLSAKFNESRREKRLAVYTTNRLDEGTPNE
jgi:hypothetical protein